MPPNVISRYQPTFRKDEIDLIIRFALRGESLSLMGIAGVGKSNIVNFLRDLSHNAPQAEQEITQLFFPIVDTPQWQGTPNSLWKMMVEALDQATKELSSPPGDNKVIPFAKDERTFNALQERLQWLCQERHRQVMFVLDDFDPVFEAGPLSMLERLNGLRSGGLRGCLSYLIFSKKLPHVLGRKHDLEKNSKFYDLFRHNIYALTPYIQDDAIRMLQHLNEVANSPLTESQLKEIYQLAGGHARLLRLVFNIWIEEGASGIKTTYFANKPDIQQECQRILTHLHTGEREVALRLGREEQKAEDEAVIDHLVRRGLLMQSNPLTWFSPLFYQCLRTYGGSVDSNLS